MNHCNLNDIVKLVCLWLITAIPLHGAALEEPSAEAMTRGDLAIALADGVVVGPEKSVLYLLEPDGLVARVVETGDLVWQRDVHWKPLSFYGDYLVAFAAQPAARRVSILFMDTRNGQTIDQVEFVIPAPARPLLADRPNEQFNVSAGRDESELLMRWDYAAKPLRGMPMNAGAGAGVPAAGSGQSSMINSGGNGTVRIGGVFSIDPVNRTVTLLDAGTPTTSPPAFDPLVDTGATRSTANAERTFQSRDGEHRLASKRIATEARRRYRWTLSDTADGILLGRLEMPLAYAPFIVVGGGNLMHIEPPTLLREETAGEFVAFGLRLIVTDMAAGSSRWSIELSDPKYRGELPP